IVRVEIIKKIFVTVILAVTIPLGATIIAWDQVAVALFDMCINFGANQRYSGYRWCALAADVLPVVALCGVMYASVWGVGVAMADCGVGVRLGVEILVGIAAYVVGAWVFRFPQWREVMKTLK
ncbi:MAG: hypothetical protein J6R31_01120, partial [Rikenellaceae bacterium]|nr:hypothetical protein [Rikenellaceae bacterium]